jgi:hypothetical protein
MLNQGIYEQIINKLVTSKLERVDRDKFFIKDVSTPKNWIG